MPNTSKHLIDIGVHELVPKLVGTCLVQRQMDRIISLQYFRDHFSTIQLSDN